MSPKKDIKFVAVESYVTEYMPKLFNVAVRGHVDSDGKPNEGWQTVGGTWNGYTNVVVIGTSWADNADTSDIVLHELGHALDYFLAQKGFQYASSGEYFKSDYIKANSSRAFIKQGTDYYYNSTINSDPSGKTQPYLQETYAESFANYFRLPETPSPPYSPENNVGFLNNRTSLYEYWRNKKWK